MDNIHIKSRMNRFYVILVAHFTSHKKTMYEARFEWWNKTDYDVTVLNSANMKYEESAKRFSNIRFINVPDISKYGMARGEAYSLLYLNKIVNLSKAEWVVKITAKYIIPNLTSYFHVSKNCKLYVQTSFHRGAQSSEIFAFKNTVAIFDSLRQYNFSRCEHACWKCGNCFENWLYIFEQKIPKNTCHFPNIKIDTAWRTPRSHGQALAYL